MSGRWSPGRAYTFQCRCGLKLIAGDAVELEHLKREHFDFHAVRREAW